MVVRRLLFKLITALIGFVSLGKELDLLRSFSKRISTSPPDGEWCHREGMAWEGEAGFVPTLASNMLSFPGTPCLYLQGVVFITEASTREGSSEL